MKTQRKSFRQVSGVLLLAGSVVALAQNYAIDWFKIAGGAGTSTGGVYSAGGTIGQPDAGQASGGQFSVEGGFWAMGAIQTTNAPPLTLWRTVTNTIALAWPNPSTGFALQEDADLSTTNWVDVATPPVVVGEQKQVVLPVAPGNRFYRLKKSGP